MTSNTREQHDTRQHISRVDKTNDRSQYYLKASLAAGEIDILLGASRRRLCSQRETESLSVMASTMSSGNNGTDSREMALVEAISRKRQQLDGEIETFRALKDQEFRAFEYRLRHTPGPLDVPKVESSLKFIRARIKMGKTAKEKKGHEREQEFSGLFTPSFLPLMGERNAQEERERLARKPLTEIAFRDREDYERVRLKKEKGRELTDEEELGVQREEDERVKLEKEWRDGEEESRDEAKRMAAAAARLKEEGKEASKEHSNAKRAAQPMLSSSAEYRRSGMASPPATPARPLSSSVPPQHALDQRRLSSRSDASMDGLRSSLRNSREPRSPKRVQFSIDDAVVSPSTSPIARRAGKSTAANATVPAMGSKGFERFEVLKGQREGKTSTNGVEGTTSSTANNANSSFDSYAQSFDSQPNTTLPSSTSAEESFDILDNDDDVFSFDEDLSSKENGGGTQFDEEEAFDDDDQEPEKGDGQPLTGSSPHAGSLPIEIKWPASMKRNVKDD